MSADLNGAAPSLPWPGQANPADVLAGFRAALAPAQPTAAVPDVDELLAFVDELAVTLGKVRKMLLVLASAKEAL